MDNRPVGKGDSLPWPTWATMVASTSGTSGRTHRVGTIYPDDKILIGAFASSRPTIRPAHQRHPQPNFVFPLTPPQTAGLGAVAKDRDKRPRIADVGKLLHDSSATPSQVPSTPTTLPLRTLLSEDQSASRPGHRRALSDSTIQESSVARESDAGGFKIVITKPGDEHRPKTLEDIDPNNPPHLEIPIPSWKLGTPRWSTRGTPFMRGSSYAPTEELRSSHTSPRTPRFGSSTPSRRPGSIVVPTRRISGSQRYPYIGSAGLSPEHALRSTYLSTRIVIEPAMFDALTFKPACDDRAIVRYSAATGAVTAATPPRLVAEITSPSFLDYELLSDFFLTYRAFLAPVDLIKMLFARMRWALAREDECGMVVRVRTFVALRHWILNYFVDDFLCEYEMRTGFCTLLNSLTDELCHSPTARRVQLKILAELKKCWRRVCAQFWDGPEFDANLPGEAPITPGGIPGHRNPSLDPGFWKQFLRDAPPQLDAVYAPLTSNPPEAETSFLRDMAHIGTGEWAQVAEPRPGTPHDAGRDKTAAEEAPLSPRSISSVEAVSCSLPLRLVPNAPRNPLAAHPVEAPIHEDPIATTPRALSGKRVRAQQSHKRNNSTSDSLRGHDTTTLEQLLQKNTETLLSLPYAGSLVRGNVLPPGQAFVEVISPTMQGASRQTTYLRVQSDDAVRDNNPPSAMSGQGMRRLIGSVRRVLSTRGQEMSPTQGNFNISPIGPKGVTTNRLPGTALVPQSVHRARASRPPVRIDLLGAEVVEDFKRVIREDAAAEAAARSFHGSIPSTPSTVKGPVLSAKPSTTRNDGSLSVPRAEDSARPSSEGELTTGSKSILIFDDTLRVPNEHPAMTGALPAFNPSMEAFADSFLPQGADPTPPNTPPGRHTDTPRRSSYLLGQHTLRAARSADDLPPFVPDLSSLESEPSLGGGPSSSDTHPRPIPRPPLSGLSHHQRNRSSRSARSFGTLGPRRYASYHSALRTQSMARSFDTTTYSERASADQSSEIPAPPPLRVLRRRPGGDLRAAGNVVDLGQGLRRSRSIGSVTTRTFTDSFGTSFIHSPGLARESTALVDIVSSECSRDRAGVFSLGMMVEPRRKISLLSTFSSKPVMRPSFEAEAQKLANIPDDDDDGGVESALLKLEGKYEKRAFKLSMEPSNAPLRAAKGAETLAPTRDDGDELDSRADKRKRRREHIGEDGVASFSPADDDSMPLSSSEDNANMLEDGRPLRDEARSFLSERSNDSDNSIPLLQRGLTDDGRQSRAAWTNRSILQDDEEGGTSADEDGEHRHGSYEIVEKSESIEKIRPGDTMPTRDRMHSGQSFLDIESDDDELSSEMSEMPADDEVPMSTVPSLRRGASLPKIQTFDSTANVPELHASQVYGTKPLPPTPEYTPTYGQPGPADMPYPGPTGVNEAFQTTTHTMQAEANVRKYSAHLPFVLAFDSEVLAQQFTLIEKDALNEIDWKELIDMRWKNADNNDCRSWVHFLRDTEARGVEVVIARFNIVVKWAISEIVLTQDTEERARCIIKYIHIAGHCRRYRNFATMSQIAVALTSAETSRLTKTWKMVPAHDIRTLRELEALISPTRNFYALRAEMEGGGLASADMGCIPFVGIYTHDLIFNSQRPCEIASSPTTAPLVNFERCRIAAGIVKALLRLLEASTLYNFQPIEGITERCLWMSALSDEDIRRHSESLE